MKHVEELADQLVALDVKELKHLSSYLKDKYGLEAAVATIAEATKEEEIVEEKPEFLALKIQSYGSKKLSLVKELNQITGCGLKNAKEAIDEGGLLFKNKTREEIEYAAKTFEAASEGFMYEIISQEKEFKQ